MTLQNSIFSITKISISMFIETIVYKQIKIKSISAPLGSTLTTTTYVINICPFIPEKNVYIKVVKSQQEHFCVRARNVYRLSI